MKKSMRTSQETSGNQAGHNRPRVSPEISEFVHMLSVIEDRIASNPADGDDE